MLVRDAMSTPAITVGLEATYHEIVHVLLSNDISGVPVVDRQHRLLGIVTEADLVIEEAYGFSRRRALGFVDQIIGGHRVEWAATASELTAGDVMTPEAVVAGLDDNLVSIARLMIETPCKRLPVVHDDVVVGVISRQDLLRRFDRTDREIAIDVSALLADPTRSPGAASVTASVSHGIVTLRGTMTDIDQVQSMEDELIEVDGVDDLDDQITVAL